MALERTKIIDAALGLLDEVGLEGLTMRKLATRIGAQAPAIYWHFANKPALLDAMAEQLLAGVADKITPTSDCAEALRQCAIEVRRALLSRRDGARTFAGTFVASPNVMNLANTTITPFLNAGFEPAIAGRLIFSIFYFVLGFVIEEQALHEQVAGSGVVELLTNKYEAIAIAHPQLAPALTTLFDDDQDARFLFGVDLMLAHLKN